MQSAHLPRFLSDSVHRRCFCPCGEDALGLCGRFRAKTQQQLLRQTVLSALSHKRINSPHSRAMWKLLHLFKSSKEALLEAPHSQMGPELHSPQSTCSPQPPTNQRLLLSPKPSCTPQSPISVHSTAPNQHELQPQFGNYLLVHVGLFACVRIGTT